VCEKINLMLVFFYTHEIEKKDFVYCCSMCVCVCFFFLINLFTYLLKIISWAYKLTKQNKISAWLLAFYCIAPETNSDASVV
jgi:hypothetical protein